MRVHSTLTASLPTWCAMPAARGENTVKSLPRSFCNFSCGATLAMIISSLMFKSASVLAVGLRAASARPASCLSRNVWSACGSVV